MNNKSTRLAIVNKNTLETRKSVDFDDYFISGALQTSLEFHELIAIFSNKIQSLIPHSGYEYRNKLFDLNINNGIITRNYFSYALKFEYQELGEIKLMRNQRFQQTEIQKLEALLMLLFYPLRNATLYRQALQMAYTDPLTKVNNRTTFNDVITRELQLARRNNRHLSLVFLDIDHFKILNDNHGHACGDFALSSVANTLRLAVRATDIVFRYGGEEFVIVLSDTPKAGAEIIAERIRNEINKQSLVYGDTILDITASLGISTLQAEDTTTTLVERADHAMYLAKQNGRNRVQVA
ncbi:MAG: GGDEF domain-containing protein [Methylococcaceae bacterium]|nr:GGDEF domain-containing protein [Methylococcaceae bacterium]